MEQQFSSLLQLVVDQKDHILLLVGALFGYKVLFLFHRIGGTAGRPVEVFPPSRQRSRLSSKRPHGVKTKNENTAGPLGKSRARMPLLIPVLIVALVSSAGLLDRAESGFSGKEEAPRVNNKGSGGSRCSAFASLAEQSLADKEYMAAAGYYAEACSLWDDNGRTAREMRRLALDAFQKALEHRAHPYERVSVVLDGIHWETFLLYPQSYEPGQDIPVIIEIGGTERLMPLGYAEYEEHWNEKGFAWIGFDVPEQGASAGPILSDRTIDVLYGAVIEALRRAGGSIDTASPFVSLRSIGGNARLYCPGNNAAVLSQRKGDKIVTLLYWCY